MVEAPGKMLIKVSSIIIIVCAGIMVLMLLLMIAGAGIIASGAFDFDMLPGVGDMSALMGMDSFNGVASFAGGILIVLAIFMLALVAYEIYVGIVGIKHCNDVKKGTVLMIHGIIWVALQGILVLMSAFNWVTLIPLAALIIYLIGAIKNKNAVSAATAAEAAVHIEAKSEESNE